MKKENWTDKVLREAKVKTVRSLDHMHLPLIETKLRERLGDQSFSCLDHEIEAVLESEKLRRGHFKCDRRSGHACCKFVKLRRDVVGHGPLIEALSNGAAEITHRFGELKGVCIFFDSRSEKLTLSIGH